MTDFDFSRVKGLLFDMDGVWFVGEDPIAGAVETLAHIRSKGLPCRFITNTTMRSLDDLVAKMARLGLDVGRDEIINAPHATALFLRERGAPSCHLLVDDHVRAEFADFPVSDRPDYVVVGDIGDAWNYRVLDEAFRMLIGGAELVAMHKGRYWQVEDGLALDIGAFVAGLEYASGKRATLVGKPAPAMFRSALADIGLDGAEVVMVGDDILSDVGGAQGAGIAGVLVETGKYRAELVAASGVTPDAVLDSVADLKTLL